jgi:hypothetical protein
MEDAPLARATTAYTADLDRTLRKLQERVKEQEALLGQVSIQLGLFSL